MSTFIKADPRSTLNIRTMSTFKKVHSLPLPYLNPEYLKKERNSSLIYLMYRPLILVGFGLHIFLIYKYKGNLAIFTFIPVLILLFFSYYKKELVVNNLKGFFKIKP